MLTGLTLVSVATKISGSCDCSRSWIAPLLHRRGNPLQFWVMTLKDAFVIDVESHSLGSSQTSKLTALSRACVVPIVFFASDSSNNCGAVLVESLFPLSEQIGYRARQVSTGVEDVGRRLRDSQFRPSWLMCHEVADNPPAPSDKSAVGCRSFG